MNNKKMNNKKMNNKKNIIITILVILFILVTIYFYILKKNNILFNTRNKQKINSLLDNNESIWFEVFEICVILIVIFFLYKEKQYLLLIIFTLIFFEHLNQIIFCYRQHLDSLQIITIIINIIFVTYSYYVKCYWVIPLFIIGTLIHVISIYTKKSFTDIVCLKHINQL